MPLFLLLFLGGFLLAAAFAIRRAFAAIDANAGFALAFRVFFQRHAALAFFVLHKRNLIFNDVVSH